MVGERKVPDRTLLAVALSVIIIALQFAALNFPWYIIEMHTQRTDLDLDGASWNTTSFIQYDLLHERSVIIENSEYSWLDAMEPWSITGSYTEKNIEMLGDYDNTVLSKRVTITALYISMIFSIITLFFVVLRSAKPFANEKRYWAPAALALMYTASILVCFPFIFDPLPDVSEGEPLEIICEEESSIVIPKVWESSEGENCQINSDTNTYNIQAAARVSSGYFIELGVILLQFFILYLVRRTE